MKVLKTLLIIVLVLGVIILIGWGAFRWFTHQAIPQTSGKITVKGLSQPVEVVRDAYGVAHIYAQNPADLYFAEGYTHAQERFWQMEFQRRVGAGRLSEIFGDTTLGTDKYLRNFGFYDLAQRSYELLDPETKALVDAYSAGVNTYISGRSPAQLGLEFALLGVQGNKWQIEPWKPADSLVWGEMMIYDQADILSPELYNIDALAEVGQKMFDDIHLTEYRADRPTIIQSRDLQALSQTPRAQNARANASRAKAAGLGPEEIAYLLKFRQEMKSNPVPEQLAMLGLGLSGGSNSFAVSGKLTQTGKPLLANDPHMSINMPALWYQVGMHCTPETADCPYNFRGYSLPGVPGILIGFNDHIAWGLTNAYFDAEDVFIEKINPANPNQYEADGKWEDMQIRREEIKVRGQEKPVVVYVRSTRNGLVASDYLVDRKNFSSGTDGPELYALSFAWTALQPVQSIQAVMNVNKAQNWEEFVAALEYFEAGKQNWLYADTEGNIGYYMPGNVPIRAGGDGTMPVPGWNEAYRWTGFIPFDKLPHVLNPQQGFIAAPNNPQVRYEDYSYSLGVIQDRGQRAARITSLIQGDKDGITIDVMSTIQTDNQEIASLEILPYLTDLSLEDADLSAARDRLVKWDGQMYTDRPEAALYNLFWKRLMADTFHDQLSPDLYPSGDNYWEDVIYFLLKDPQNAWWDDRSSADKVETRDDILGVALEEAYSDGLSTLGKDFSTWKWGDLHTITFRNATLGKSGISLIENIFNRGPFAVNGSTTSVQKTCWDVNADSFEADCIPAMRQVIDLSNLSGSRMVHSVGQSGHPYDAHYDDLIELWRTFKYIPVNWTRPEAEAGKHQTLVLTP